MRPLAALTAALAALAACADVECTRNTDCGDRARCEMNRCVSDCRSDRDCKAGATCSLNGECVAPRPADDVPEAGAPDATTDAAPDATTDAAPDAPKDAAPDAAMDAAPDAAMDAALDAAVDADAAVDRPAMDAPDIAPDIPSDVAPDAACTPLAWRASTVAGAGDWGGSTAIAIDPAGAPHVVFHRAAYGSYGARQLLYASRNADGTWALDQIAMGTGNDRDDTTDLAFDPAGAPHVVFPGLPTSGSAAAHATRVGGAWVITFLRGGTTWASLGVDAAGAAHVVSGQTEINYARRAPDGAWSHEAQRPARCMNAAVSPDGTVHVSFATPPPSATGFNDLFYATRSPAGTWAYERVDSLGARFDYECGTAIGVAPDGAVHVLYTAAGGLRHASRAAGGAWRTQALTAAGGGWPAVAVDARGGVHAAFGGALQYAYLPPGGAWRSAAVDLSPGSVPGYDSSIAVDATGAVHLASYEEPRPSPFRIYYTVGRPCAP